jgi:hypothetical protein
VDGAAAAPPPAGDAAGLSIGEGFRGAITLCQLYDRALTAAEVARLCAAWKSDRTPPKPDPASLAEAPRIVTPAMVTLAATRSEDAGGGVQYWFAEAATGAASGWLDRPAWRHDGLEPDREYAYTVRVRDAAGNVTAPSAPATVRTDASRFTLLRDDFEKDHDYKASGAEGTMWDGVFGAGNATAARASGGRLHLESPRSYWIDQEPKGLLVYKIVAGDFAAEVELADMMGLAKKEAVGNQAGGLMVRVGDLAAAGPGEDLLLHSIFPAWGCGNIVTSLDSGGRPEWTSRTGWNFDRFLQMERRGILFHLRTSRDGKTWTDMPGSPVERRDLKDLPLQVGLYHATHGGDKGWVEFRRFRLCQRRG